VGYSDSEPVKSPAEQMVHQLALGSLVRQCEHRGNLRRLLISGVARYPIAKLR
jgi:hypothetical protein